MVTVLAKRDPPQGDILVLSKQRLSISYSPSWPHCCCYFGLSRRDYLFLSLSQWLSHQGSSCNQCDVTQRRWSWKPGRSNHLSAAGKGRKILFSRLIACKGCWQYPGHFFSEWNLFPVLLTWFTHVYGKLSHEEESCRKPRREMRCPELLASDTSKEMSRVKRSIKERKQSVMGKGRQTRTQERTSMKRNNNYVSYIFGNGLTNWALLAPPIWIKIPAHTELDIPFNRLAIGVPRGRGNRNWSGLWANDWKIILS